MDIFVLDFLVSWRIDLFNELSSEEGSREVKEGVEDGQEQSPPKVASVGGYNSTEDTSRSLEVFQKLVCVNNDQIVVWQIVVNVLGPQIDSLLEIKWFVDPTQQEFGEPIGFHKWMGFSEGNLIVSSWENNVTSFSSSGVDTHVIWIDMRVVHLWNQRSN